MTLKQTTQPYDLILLDPPFAQGWLPKLWPWLTRALAPQGWVYVECEAPIHQILSEPLQALSAQDALPGGWQILRHDKAGQVHYHLLQLQAE
jgi:16S rRNA G966 N2-methylase RsmD